MIIRDYEEHLKAKGLSEKSIRIYTERIQRFLNSNFSENDLIGFVDELIEQYSKGNSKYDPDDHGYTRAALGHLKDLILAPYTQNLFISYNKSFQSFEVLGQHASKYIIHDQTITISYNKGFVPLKTVTKKIAKKDYYKLIDLLLKYRHLLSPSNTVINAFHGPTTSYSYYLDEIYNGTDCSCLFDGVITDPMLKKATEEYRIWLSKFISEV